MWKPGYLRSVIYNSFFNDFTIRDLYDLNIIRGEYDLLWRPCVGHLIHWQGLEERPGTYNTLLNLPWSRSILRFPKISVRESSPSTIGGPFDMSSEVNASLVETICLEAPQSMMKLGGLDVLILAHDLGTRNQNHQRIINKYSWIGNNWNTK